MRLDANSWQVEITRVRTVMSNPNNDADGVQTNFYTLEDMTRSTQNMKSSGLRLVLSKPSAR